MRESRFILKGKSHASQIGPKLIPYRVDTFIHYSETGSRRGSGMRKRCRLSLQIVNKDINPQRQPVCPRRSPYRHNRAGSVQDHVLGCGAEHQFADFRTPAHADDNLIDAVIVGKLHQVLAGA